jgi:hypothetical protein
MHDEQGREVWFVRRYWLDASPVHWKGVAVMLAGILGGISGALGAGLAGQQGLGGFIFLAALAWMALMIETHIQRV